MLKWPLPFGRIAVRFTKRFMPSLNLLSTDINDDGGGKHQVAEKVPKKSLVGVFLQILIVLDSKICEVCNLSHQVKHPMSNTI